MESLLKHSGHDFTELEARWRKLADNLNIELREICVIDGYPILSLKTTGSEPIYLSAGVHGDECATIWGLLQWAEQNGALLANRPFQIFPCLNPVGIIDNTRTDSEGRDLNRRFEDRSVPVIAAWQSHIKNQTYRASLHLHEDYDSTGTYLYEISESSSIGRLILEACETIIPYDRGPEIDGREFDHGLLHHPFDEVQQLVEEELDGGYPEAIYLALHHTKAALTFETPSELDLSLRIAAHRKAIETFVALD